MIAALPDLRMFMKHTHVGPQVGKELQHVNGAERWFMRQQRSRNGEAAE